MSSKKLEPYKKEYIASEEHDELRFTRDNYGMASAFLTYPLTGEEKLVGRVDLVTGQCKVNGKNYTLNGAPDEIFHKFQVNLNWYVDNEKENSYMFPISIEHSDKIEGLRYIMWNDGSGRAEYNGEMVGSIDLMTGETEIGDSGYIPAPYADRSELLNGYKEDVEKYVKDNYNIAEKEQSSMKNINEKNPSEYTVRDIAVLLEQFYYNRGIYDRPFDKRPYQFIDYPITADPSPSARYGVTQAIETDIVSSTSSKADIIKFLEDELSYTPSYNEYKIGEKCLQALKDFSIEKSFTPYGTMPDRDKLVNSESKYDREEAAQYCYALDRLMYDDDFTVRASVVNTGYKPEAFFADESDYVREKAIEKYIRKNQDKVIALDDNINIQIEVEENDQYGNAYEMGVKVYDKMNNQLAEAHSIPADDFVDFLDEVKKTGGDCQKLARVDFIQDYNDNTYIVKACYQSNYVGYEDIMGSNDWSKVEEFAHEKAMQGLYVEIKNDETGKTVRLDPDKYQDEFELANGEFPYKPKDLDCDRYNVYATNKDYCNLEAYLYTNEWDKVQEFSEKWLNKNCNIEISDNTMICLGNDGENLNVIKIRPIDYSEYGFKLGDIPIEPYFFDVGKMQDEAYHLDAGNKMTIPFGDYKAIVSKDPDFNKETGDYNNIHVELYENTSSEHFEYFLAALKDIDIREADSLFLDLKSVEVLNKGIDGIKSSLYYDAAATEKTKATKAPDLYNYYYDKENMSLKVYEGERILAEISDVTSDENAKEFFKEAVYDARGIDLDNCSGNIKPNSEPSKSKPIVERD